MLIRIKITVVNNKFHSSHTSINKIKVSSPLTPQHKKSRCIRLQFSSQQTPTMPKVQPLSPQSPQMPATFSSPLTQKPLSLLIPAVICNTKRCLANNRSFPLSLTLSAPLFSSSLPNAVATNVCQRTNKPDYIPSPLILIIDPLPHQQQFSYFRHFIPFPIPAHLQILRNLQIIFSHISCPHTTQNFQIHLKYLNLTILNLLFYLFSTPVV